MNTKLPKELFILIQNIARNLDRKDAVEFSKDVEQAIASDNKDLSLVHFAFMRDMLKRRAERSKITQDVISGLDLLAEGKDWPEQEVVYCAVTVTWVASYAFGDALAYYAVRSVCTEGFYDATSEAADYAALASDNYEKERKLQAASMIVLLEDAPIMENKNGNAN